MTSYQMLTLIIIPIVAILSYLSTALNEPFAQKMTFAAALGLTFFGLSNFIINSF